MSIRHVGWLSGLLITALALGGCANKCEKPCPAEKKCPEKKCEKKPCSLCPKSCEAKPCSVCSICSRRAKACPVSCERTCAKPCPVKCEKTCAPKACPVKCEKTCAPTACPVKCEQTCRKPCSLCGSRSGKTCPVSCEEKTRKPCSLCGARCAKTCACKSETSCVTPTVCPVKCEKGATCPRQTCPTESGSLVGFVEPAPPISGPVLSGGTVVPPIVRDAALSREPGAIVDADPSGPDSWALTIWSDGRLRDLEVRNDGLILSDVKNYKEDMIRDLPPTVRNSVESTFPGAIIYNVDEGATDGQAAYRIEVLQNGQHLFAIVAPNGTLINQGLAPPTGR